MKTEILFFTVPSPSPVPGIVRAQKIIVDKEWIPGIELTNLKGVEEAEHNLLLLSAGKFCLRHQEKEQKSKEDKNKSGSRKENLSI